MVPLTVLIMVVYGEQLFSFDGNFPDVAAYNDALIDNVGSCQDNPGRVHYSTTDPEAEYHTTMDVPNVHLWSACPRRLKLTTADPYKKGQVVSTIRADVKHPWSTVFDFIITNPSRECLRAVRMNRRMDTELFELCSHDAGHVGNHTVPLVTGGDGFSFMISNMDNMASDPEGNHASSFEKTEGGNGLGYAGMTNTLVIEFDASPNTDADIPYHHICVHSCGYQRKIRSSRYCQLSSCIRTDFKFGTIRTVGIRFSKEVDATALAQGKFYNTRKSEQYIGADVGSLCVWMDQDLILCILIDIARTLELWDENFAIVGFTAATGDHFQAMDIIRWTFCEDTTCF